MAYKRYQIRELINYVTAILYLFLYIYYLERLLQ